MSATEWTAPNPKYPPPKAGEPPLHRAACMGDDDAIPSLAASADLESVFDLQLDPGALSTPATPLMVAAGSGDGATAGTVALLLRLGADPRTTAGGRSAADFACSGLGWNYRPGGDAARLQLLLEAGSPLSVTGESGARLVGTVAASGDAARLAVLLAHGASPLAWNDPEERERTDRQFELVAGESYASLLDQMGIPDDIRREMAQESSFLPDVEAPAGPYGFLIPLFCAVEGDSIACVRLLLEAGADVRQRDDQARTALWKARSEPMVRLLLEKGLDLEDRDRFDWTPLDAAAMDGIEGLPRLRALLAAGADPNATHDRGYTVFMSAAASSERHLETLRALIEGGADPHAVSDLGYNAFHAAVDVNGEANSEESVRSVLTFLRDAGLDIEARERNAHTPLARAILEGNGKEVRVLVELGADPGATAPGLPCGGACSAVPVPLIFHAISAAVHPVEKVEALLRGGARLDVVDPDGLSPLEFARAYRKDLETWEEGEFKQRCLDDLGRCIEILQRAPMP
jgi:ankyrin repeat protein